MINEILNEISNKGRIEFYGHDSNEKKSARDRLVREGYIKEDKKGIFILTEKGAEALDLGGYQKYKEKKNKESLRDNKIKELTLKQLKGNIFQIKFWWLLIIINALFAILASNFRLILSWLGF